MPSLRNALVFALLCIVWTMLVGKDLGWDAVNHHFYLPFAWAEGRVVTDLYAAGPQSYQNPLGFFPFYFMVHWAWPSWLVGCTLALLHAFNLVFVERLARSLWGDAPGRELWIVLSVLLAGMAPVFLFVLGSSTVDAIGSALVLASLLALVSDSTGRRARSALLFAGLMLAIAFSIKQSNAVFVLAAAALLLWQWVRGRRCFCDLVWCAVGVALGLAAGMGWYSWVMWQHFANPVFPLFNDIFQSPYAAASAIAAGRFVAEAPQDLLWRLWDFAQMKRFVYYEGFAPDLRPALLVFVGAMALTTVLIRWVLHRARGRVYGVVDVDLLLFTAVAYGLWMLTSGNGRYALPIFLLCGLLLVRCLYVFMAPQIARPVLLLVVLAQGGLIFTASDLRFTAEPWDSSPFYKVHASERLVTEPYLHLSLGIQTHASIIAAAFHREGALVNAHGQVSLPLDQNPLGQAFQARLDAWRGRTRVIVAEFDRTDAGAQERARLGINRLLYRMDLQVDTDDCEAFGITLAAPEKSPMFVWLHRRNVFISSASDIHYLSCAVYEHSEPDQNLESTMARAQEVFAVMEQACPSLYSPPGFTADRGEADWRRFYANSDATAIVSEEYGVMVQSPRSPVDRVIGSVDEILQGRGNFDCRRWNLVTPD